MYDFPGQKRDPPEQRDPLRIFYETLYQQKPTSELAAVWMMESGLLPLKEAKQVYENKMKKKNQKITSPVKHVKTVKETKSVTVKKKVVASTPKSSSTKKTETSTVKKQSRKRKAESSEENSSSEEDSEEDYALSNRKVAKKARVN
ncbi:uncharacterized protein LOC104905118 isoform X1 [Beta vulgaris subsp. vulgaris]|uniref:uncharacterized protein LOC104905118 isoform X1 n=1 Tax=Beta vulgaris subsp. vulgaris TaxID=3555 RepID=UPI0025486639|nr:uncharacterized protein LOC104905118 isoform X1 [Beta vulgaris subsp. vulgaris]